MAEDIAGLAFSQSKWIRDKYSIAIQERATTVDDIISGWSGISASVQSILTSTYNMNMGDSETIELYYSSITSFKMDAPNYKKALDLFICRQPFYTLSAHKECRTESVTKADIDAYYSIATTPSTIAGTFSAAFRIWQSPSSPQSYDLTGWLLKNMDCNDRKNGLSDVTATWTKKGAWTLVYIG